MLEKLRREFADNLVVLPTEAATETLKSYAVTAYPTVALIDRDGKIVFYHVGAGGEKAIRASLVNLGVVSAPAKTAPEKLIPR